MKRTAMAHHHAPRRALYEQGVALVVSLVMLLVMTMIGVAAMHTNVLEEKMAGNFRDASLAFQAAEAALRDAEAYIIADVSGLTGFNSTCSDGLCDATGGLSEVWYDDTKKTNAVQVGTSPSTTAQMDFVAQQPRFWVEGFKVWPPGSAAWKPRYRITAIGYGGNANTRVMLQSVYAP